MKDKKIVTIGLTKETESPENPGGLEKRVAMIPGHIKALVEHGCEVFIETGAGEGIGYSDKEYQTAGATLQSGDEIYSNKDMVIKFKGPSLENIKKMNSQTILFCMAHFKSFPKRAKLLEECKINVIAMEEILESPKYISDEIILSKRFVAEKIADQQIPCNELHVGFLGYSPTVIGGIRRAGNRNPKSHTLYQKDIELDELKHLGESTLYFYDSRVFTNSSLVAKLKSLSCLVFDLYEYAETKGMAKISEHRKSHRPFELGVRRIQCLHETGMAGARYGFHLLNKNSPNDFESKNVRVSVLGYGNVAIGAIRECYDQGVRVIQILGRAHTGGNEIGAFIEKSNLIINGAEQEPELRGINYLIKRNYVGPLIKAGSVVIDLVGGSAPIGVR